MPSPPARARRAGPALIAGTVLLAAGLSGCSDAGTTDTGAPAAGAGPTTNVPEVQASLVGIELPPPFEGSMDAFYEVPDPLPAGPAGRVVRRMAIGAPADGGEAWRIMYLSEDGAGRVRAVTGTLVRPVGDAPDGGWPVISWAHGTTGLASRCAPSRSGAHGFDVGVDAVRVATDYIGLGPTGERHAYLSRPSEGHSVIDAVRAARHLLGGEASARWTSVGHSQGGHAAQAAHELAAERAPELELLGTVSYAPAVMFERTYGGIDEVVARIVAIMGLYGLATEDDDLEPADYVTDAARTVEPVLDEGCLPEIIDAYVAAGPLDLFAVDPFTNPTARDLLTANDVGRVAVEAPLLVVTGTADDRVVLPRVEDLYERLCAAGQDTELVVVDGATHDDVIGRTRDLVRRWIDERIDGRAAVEGCERSTP